ncbi:MAG: hypothetical protein KDK66_03305 [Deltaproteobacteria bacterium]|nr:hypothetical protein [Deltaproteobacteria bacterium]
MRLSTPNLGLLCKPFIFTFVLVAMVLSLPKLGFSQTRLPSNNVAELQPPNPCDDPKNVGKEVECDGNPCTVGDVCVDDSTCASGTWLTPPYDEELQLEASTCTDHVCTCSGAPGVSCVDTGVPIPGCSLSECETVQDCEGWDTVDACSTMACQDGQCMTTVIPGCEENIPKCTTDSDCEADGNVCTTSTCVEGVCSVDAAPVGTPCGTCGKCELNAETTTSCVEDTSCGVTDEPGVTPPPPSVDAAPPPAPANPPATSEQDLALSPFNIEGAGCSLASVAGPASAWGLILLSWVGLAAFRRRRD